MNGHLFTFRLHHPGQHGNHTDIYIPAYSPAMGWAAAAAYVGAHVCNPPIRTLELVAVCNIVEEDRALGPKEVSTATATNAISRPRG